jgi:hypothetical protein
MAAARARAEGSEGILATATNTGTSAKEHKSLTTKIAKEAPGSPRKACCLLLFLVLLGVVLVTLVVDLSFYRDGP